jgi:hypothetical protein
MNALRVIAQGVARQVLDRGYFREEEDGRLSTDFSYREDKLALNGQSLDLGELIVSMASGSLPQ